MATKPSWIRRGAGLVATLFGAVTIFAGGRILLGLADAGYYVLRPVLVFNTVMGAAYVLAGLAAWRSARAGAMSAGVIALLNLGVLVAILVRHATGGAVANETLAAMTLRTVVWVALFLVLLWERGRRAETTPAG